MVEPRLSVLLVGQRSLTAQRRGRFVAGSGAHPARMAPDLAAAIIGDYTKPGDLVFDPLAGIGTTLVEAVHADRDALGMDIEPGWVTLARANIALARAQGATGTATVITGDATRLPARIPMRLRGAVDLVLTSPPYGPTMHGRVEHRRGPLTRFHNTYTAGDTRSGANLAHAGRRGLADGIGAVLAGCVPLLKPGGVIVVVSRPWRRDGDLVDIPGQVITAGLDAGLTFVDCRRAVHAALRDGQLHARHTFFQLVEIRKARLAGRPISLIQHDDLAVFTTGDGPHRTLTAGRGTTQPSNVGEDCAATTGATDRARPPRDAPELHEHEFPYLGSCRHGESRYPPSPTAPPARGQNSGARNAGHHDLPDHRATLGTQRAVTRPRRGADHPGQPPAANAITPARPVVP